MPNGSVVCTLHCYEVVSNTSSLKINMSDTYEQWYTLKFLIKLNKESLKSYCELKNVYDDACRKKSTCLRWRSKFLNGREMNCNVVLVCLLLCLAKKQSTQLACWSSPTLRITFDKTVHAHFKKLRWLLMVERIDSVFDQPSVVNWHAPSDLFNWGKNEWLGVKSRE